MTKHIQTPSPLATLDIAQLDRICGGKKKAGKAPAGGQAAGGGKLSAQLALGPLQLAFTTT